MRNKKGFTLIELLAVIIILGIILAIAVPKILDVINNSKTEGLMNSTKAVHKSLSNQLAMYELGQTGVDNLSATAGTTCPVEYWPITNGGCTYTYDSATGVLTVNTTSATGKFKGASPVKYAFAGN